MKLRYLVCMLVLVSVNSVQAQTLAGKGFEAFGSYQSNDFDYVNLRNRNLVLDIPLISFPQRGALPDLSLSIAYNNYGWSYDYYYIDEWDFGYYWQYNGGSPWVGWMSPSLVTFSKPDDCYSPGTIYDATGASHSTGWLSPEPTSTSTPFVGESLDGTQYQVKVPSDTYGLACGSGVIIPSWSDTATVTTRAGLQNNITDWYDLAASLTDGNGNSITASNSGWGDPVTFTDSLGRSIPLPDGIDADIYLGFVDTPPSSGCHSYNYPGPPGSPSGLVSIDYCYTASVDFHAPDGTDLGTACCMLQSATLPNGASWAFTYDAEANLASVTTPTGGTISYTWEHELEGNVSGGTDYVPEVKYRDVDANDGSGAKRWTYALNTSGTRTITVTDPAGNDTVHAFATSYSGRFETETKYYTSSATSGTLLKTVDTGYSLGASGGSGFASDDNFVVPTTVTTTLPTGQVSETCTYYDNFTYGGSGTCPAPTVSGSAPVYYLHYLSTSPITYQVIFGDEVEKDEYDYTPGGLLRKTATEYQWQANSTYLSANFMDRPYSVTLYDSSNALAGKTIYSYDESSYSPSGCSSTPCGDLTTVQRYKDSTNHLDSHTTYSTYGMPTVQTDPRGNSTSYTYDATYHAFPTQIQFPTTGSVTHVENPTYDTNTGLLTSYEDQNFQTTSYGYDVMRRLTSVTYPDGGSDAYSYNDGVSYPYSPSGTLTKSITLGGLNFTQTGRVDGLARLIETDTIVPSSTCSSGHVYVDTSYSYNTSSHVRTQTVSNPDCSTSHSYSTVTNFDPLDRVASVTEQDSSTVSTLYVGNCATVTDEAGKKRKSCVDGAGRMTGVWEDPSSLNYETDYSYNALDNLTGVSQGSQTRTFSYDFLSRLTSAVNPEESGTTYYTYDANGNVLTKVDANGTTTTYSSSSYDALNRPAGKSYSDGSPTVYYYYDAPPSWYGDGDLTNLVGRLVEARSGAGTPGQSDTVTGYDPMGRVKVQWQQTPINWPAGYKTYHLYDFAGDLTSLTYPSGRVVTYQYNNDMQPTQARFDNLYGTSVGYNYLSAASYSPLGGPSSLTLGSGVVDANTYNSREQLAGRSVTSGSTAYMNLAYDYSSGSNNGNVHSITDSVDGGRTATYTYDNLNRILTAGTAGSTPYPAWGLSWSGGIDRYGNRTGQTVTTGSGPSSSISVSTSTNRITGTGYSYDSDGDLTADGTHYYYYDGENHLVQVDGTLGTCSTATACYFVDANGARVQKITGSNTTSYYYSGGKVIAEYDQGAAVNTEYVYLGDKLLTTMGEATNGGFEEGSAGWEDWSGSTSVISNATNAHSGTNYVQLSAAPPSDVATWIMSSYVPVTPGEVITFGGWAYRESGSGGSFTWFLEANNSSHTSVDWIAPTPNNVSGASWTYQIGTYTVASGVSYLRLYCTLNYVSSTSVGRCDDGFVSAGTQYYHQDHLSNRLITDSSGANIGEQGHYPYGELWYPSSPVTKLVLTGKERDSESNLDSFGPRYDSSQYGRFMTPDPMGNYFAEGSNPQSWNLYSYVQNNPLNFTDPSGLECVWDDGSFDSEFDKQTGSVKSCQGVGGTWIELGANGDSSGWDSMGLRNLVSMIQSGQVARTSFHSYSNGFTYSTDYDSSGRTTETVTPAATTIYTYGLTFSTQPEYTNNRAFVPQMKALIFTPPPMSAGDKIGVTVGCLNNEAATPVLPSGSRPAGASDVPEGHMNGQRDLRTARGNPGPYNPAGSNSEVADTAANGVGMVAPTLKCELTPR